MVSDRVWGVLACPGCGGDLNRGEKDVVCSRCAVHYPYTATRQPDFRLQSPKQYSLKVPIGEQWMKPGFEFGPIKPHPNPRFDPWSITFDRLIAFGNRLTPELVSHFPRADKPGGMMLDIGCGKLGAYAAVLKGTNLEYVGLDYDGEGADLLGDAHALPFKDGTFEFALSIAVIEHLRHPLVAMSEVFRVLKPGGLFIGTVAFIEAFHMNSFYHHSHVGTYNSLATAGFEVCQIEPNQEWSGIQAVAKMALFPGMRRKMTNLIVWPIQAMSNLWWTTLGYRYHEIGKDKTLRQLATTGGYRFIAMKPPDPK